MCLTMRDLHRRYGLAVYQLWTILTRSTLRVWQDTVWGSARKWKSRPTWWVNPGKARKVSCAKWNYTSIVLEFILTGVVFCRLMLSENSVRALIVYSSLESSKNLWKKHDNTFKSWIFKITYPVIWQPKRGDEIGWCAFALGTGVAARLQAK